MFSGYTTLFLHLRDFLLDHRGPDLHQVLRATLNETTEWLLRCETCSFESAAVSHTENDGILCVVVLISTGKANFM